MSDDYLLWFYYYATVSFYLLCGYSFIELVLFPAMKELQRRSRSAEGKKMWRHALWGRATAHAGFVALVTHSPMLGLVDLYLTFIVYKVSQSQKYSQSTERFSYYAVKLYLAAFATMFFYADNVLDINLPYFVYTLSGSYHGANITPVQ